MTQSKPLYLKDIENSPQPGSYHDLVVRSKQGGIEHWPIWNLFAFRSEDTLHLAKFTQGMVRNPASITPAFRELIAAYTSYLNRCDFCMGAHAAVASEMLKSEALVSSVLKDMENSPLSTKEKAMLRYVKKITLSLPETGQSDVDLLKREGWDDEAIYFAISVCALFNFYNRWITASGVKPVSDESFRSHGKRLAEKGYDPSKRL